MKTKKIPYYLLLFLLTGGASLILGFLSFGGMFALWPILPLAIGAFGLSVAYEGEIYFQNIKGALNKLFFKNDYLQRHLANEHLAACVIEANRDANRPAFFRDYQEQLMLLHRFGHLTLDKASRIRKKRVKKTLADMEKWFALQLFSRQEGNENDTYSHYQQHLRLWLADHQQDQEIAKLKKRTTLFRFVAGFSILSGTFMAVGTTYLLVGQFMAIPLLASIPFGVLPALVIPMAVVAGVAWGLLTYNAITDMINNDTLRKWYFKLRNEFIQDTPTRKIIITPSNVLKAVVTLGLVALAIAVTVCTAGTWWSIVKNTQPLFAWMGRIPTVVMGIINPLITGLSTLIFNTENIFETLELVDQELHAEVNIFRRIWNGIVALFSKPENETRWQFANPFRWILKLTYTPLRMLLFLLHLVSIAVTGDRMPGVPEIASTILGFISEFFEDLHYFSGSENHEHAHHEHHDHELHDVAHAHDQHLEEMLNERLKSAHGHSHDDDFPSKVLKGLFLPIMWLAAAWDSKASQGNEDKNHRLDYKPALNKLKGKKPKQTIDLTVEESNLGSPAWKVHQAVFRIERYKQQHLEKAFLGRSIAKAKVDQLTQLQTRLLENEPIAQTIGAATEDACYGHQRFFNKPTTRTQDFLAGLSERIGVSLN
jgi:hypothetical protein